MKTGTVVLLVLLVVCLVGGGFSFGYDHHYRGKIANLRAESDSLRVILRCPGPRDAFYRAYPDPFDRALKISAVSGRLRSIGLTERESYNEATRVCMGYAAFEAKPIRIDEDTSLELPPGYYYVEVCARTPRDRGQSD